MLNENKERELAYVVKVDNISSIAGRDRVECAHVNGWTCMVPKGAFQVGSLGIYFEVDSKVDETKPEFAFTAKYHGKIKTQKFKTPDGSFFSQGLLMAPADFGWSEADIKEGDYLTQKLGVTYTVEEDNQRKAKSDPNAKYKSMMRRHPRLAKSSFGKWCMKHGWAKKLLYLVLGRKKKDTSKDWPVGRFPGVSKTDQERVENMTWILNDKTPFIVTQKCDGSSGTYILEKKGKNKFEFYVCSRNVRMKNEEQECFYGSHNYYWEVAKKYGIENKMRAWLNDNSKRKWVCWQGEICAPGIQKNPHNLSETHFYCFHWTDNVNGRRDIRDAVSDWENYEMETVPIVCDNYIMPDDFEEFKKTADGYYDMSVCENHIDCKREGFVYYKTTEPTFSFKNVSREYLIKK
jgi:hypothetical protein